MSLLEEMKMKLLYVWYSPEQDKQHIENESAPVYETIAKLEDGSEVVYSEIMEDNTPSNWPDAKFLGRGDYLKDGKRVK
jgi:hypothetical protein